MKISAVYVYGWVVSLNHLYGFSSRQSKTKPIVIVYGPLAPIKERLFVRSLAISLKHLGLEKEVWFDWDEGSFSSAIRQHDR